MKRLFLVVYDYGQGGAWAFLAAESAAEISNKFPELEVVATPPEWMSKQHLQKIRRQMTFDINDDRRGFLASIVAQRGGQPEGPEASHG